MTDAPAPAAVSAVPRMIRIVASAVATLLVVVMTVVAVLLKETTTGPVAFQTSDQVAMVGLGLALGAAVLLLGRSRVDADRDGIRVRNIVVTHELPWQVIRAVSFSEHSPWAHLQLTNGDELALLAVQANDRQRAITAVRGLRALLADHRARHYVPQPDLLYPD